jgi:hypothetical protein
MFLDLFDAAEVIPSQPFDADGAIVALDVSVLLGLPDYRWCSDFFLKNDTTA